MSVPQISVFSPRTLSETVRCANSQTSGEVKRAVEVQIPLDGGTDSQWFIELERGDTSTVVTFIDGAERFHEHEIADFRVVETDVKTVLAYYSLDLCCTFQKEFVDYGDVWGYSMKRGPETQFEAATTARPTVIRHMDGDTNEQ